MDKADTKDVEKLPLIEEAPTPQMRRHCRGTTIKWCNISSFFLVAYVIFAFTFTLMLGRQIQNLNGDLKIERKVNEDLQRELMNLQQSLNTDDYDYAGNTEDNFEYKTSMTEDNAERKTDPEVITNIEVFSVRGPDNKLVKLYCEPDSGVTSVLASGPSDTGSDGRSKRTTLQIQSVAEDEAAEVSDDERLKRCWISAKYSIDTLTQDPDDNTLTPDAKEDDASKVDGHPYDALLKHQEVTGGSNKSNASAIHLISDQYLYSILDDVDDIWNFYNNGSGMFWQIEDTRSYSTSDIFEFYWYLGQVRVVRVTKPGVYRIYAQVTYQIKKSDRWEFTVKINDLKRNRCKLRDDSVIYGKESAAETWPFPVPDLTSSPSSLYRPCFTAFTVRLAVGDSVSIGCLHGCKGIVHEPQYTYWGIIEIT